MAAEGYNPQESAPMTSINVTPFVDVVLVLLVIFMVTAPMVMKDVIGLNLPKSSSKDASVAKTASVAITKNNQLLLNGNLISEEELASQMKTLVSTNPDTQVVLAADEESLHGQVVKIIDLIKSAGINRFAIQIERP
mgnify:CR=1 FL=1